MRYALAVEYDGTDFLGWQTQSQGPTVQAALERALSFVAGGEVGVVCAGRTDTGVHARGQVVHFETEANREARAWVLGGNTRLPSSVAILWAQPVSDAFHARYSARARRYRYSLLNRTARPGLDSRRLAWEYRALDVCAMHEAAQALIGEHDFTSYRTVACQAVSPNRQIQALSVSREGDRVHFDIQANAFLHHMVRNIVGSLLKVGRGERTREWIAEVLAARDRRLAGATADARGLCFLGPLYPAESGLPEAFLWKR